MSRIFPILLVAFILAGIAVLAAREFGVNLVPPDQGVVVQNDGSADSAANDASNTRPDVQTVAENLSIPWGLAFLPDGDMLVSERPGTILRIDRETGVAEEMEIADVRHEGEGGLLGMALHPNFAENDLLYLYFTTTENGRIVNTVERYRLTGTTLSERAIILDGIPGAPYHDGGRMAFGPDGYLYITTGDAGNTALAQDTDSPAGKILRIADDGSIPAENPFGNAVHSYGHRNPQGLAWDEEGHLYATEHGRSGVRSGLDELNLIEAGGNYGWPDSQGDAVEDGTIGPLIHSGADTTWAPASAAYWEGSIFFGGLRGATLYEAVLDDTEVMDLKEHFSGEFGRIRTVAVGPDGALYLTTSNRDGRGDPRGGDDKLIRIDPSQFR